MGGENLAKEAIINISSWNKIGYIQNIFAMSIDNSDLND